MVTKMNGACPTCWTGYVAWVILFLNSNGRGQRRSVVTLSENRYVSEIPNPKSKKAPISYRVFKRTYEKPVLDRKDSYIQLGSWKTTKQYSQFSLHILRMVLWSIVDWACTSSDSSMRLAVRSRFFKFLSSFQFRSLTHLEFLKKNGLWNQLVFRQALMIGSLCQCWRVGDLDFDSASIAGNYLDSVFGFQLNEQSNQFCLNYNRKSALSRFSSLRLYVTSLYQLWLRKNENYTKKV